MKTRDYLYISAKLYLNEIISRVKNNLFPKKQTDVPPVTEPVLINKAKSRITFPEFAFEFGKLFFLSNPEKEIALKDLAEKIDPQMAYIFLEKCHEQYFEIACGFLKTIMDESESEFITFAGRDYLFGLPNLNFMAAKAAKIIHPGRISELYMEFSTANSQLGMELFSKAMKIYDLESLKFLTDCLEEMRQENEENKKIKPLNEMPEKVEFILRAYENCVKNKKTKSIQFEMCVRLLEKYHLLPTTIN